MIWESWFQERDINYGTGKTLDIGYKCSNCKTIFPYKNKAAEYAPLPDKCPSCGEWYEARARNDEKEMPDMNPGFVHIIFTNEELRVLSDLLELSTLRSTQLCEVRVYMALYDKVAEADIKTQQLESKLRLDKEDG